MNRKLNLLVLGAGLLVMMLVGPAMAWEGRWLIGLDAVSSHVGESEDADQVFIDENAAGGGLQVGYMLSPSFMLRFGGAAADHATSDADIDIRFGGATLDAMYLFRDGQTFRPYVFGGLGGYKAESQKNDLVFDVTGPGLAFGGGAHLQLGNRVTLQGALRLESINWETATVTYATPSGSATVEAPIDDSGWASKISVGVGFWL